MIVVSVISLVLSLLIQGIMSNLLGYTIDNISIFSTIYVLINIVVLQQYFDNDKKILLLIVIFGMLMDIVYSNTLIFTTSIFIIIFYLNKLLSSFLPYNAFTINVFSLLSVFIYHIISFAFLKVLQYETYGIMILLKVLSCNIIMTIIYTTLLHLIISSIYKKFNLKIVRDKHM